MSRIGRVERVTPETKVLVEMELDGTGATDVETGVTFYDHMLAQFGKHAGFDVTIHSLGDLRVDCHHTVAETAIALGDVFKQALGDRAGLRRYGSVLLPVDETLVQAAADVSGRAYLVHDEPDVMQSVMLGQNFYGALVRHVWESFTHHAEVTLHVSVQTGRDRRHIAEAQFSAVARSAARRCST
ncbi:MAG: imidazoleglycerol-phosphate dehydratase [Terriglobales bacterium]